VEAARCGGSCRGASPAIAAFDAVQCGAFPSDLEFRSVDLDSTAWPIDPSPPIVVAVETVEHLENPGHFFVSWRRSPDPAAA
jgi:hypothetical protein